MADFEGFELNIRPIEKAEVIDLVTDKPVDRPDIARRAAAIFGEAIEQAGGTISVGQELEEQIDSIGWGEIGDDEYFGH